jgi:pyridoxal phosphate enzyme (YggS family)
MADPGVEYLRIREQVAAACEKLTRDPQEVTIVLVVKNQPADKIRQVIQAGAVHLAQNYPERLNQLFDEIPEAKTLTWHMIGHCQRRKAGLVVRDFSWMHSLDSLALAERLSFLALTARKVLPVMLEVNLSGEASKGGFSATSAEDKEQFMTVIDTIRALPGLDLGGLMTMPPITSNPEGSRSIFRQLKQLQQEINQITGTELIPWLSMGTSQDYNVAIEEGSTHVRLGTCVFGERKL